MGWVLAIVGALAGAVAGGALTYGTMLAREAIVVQGAVKTERDRGVLACNVRVGEIERVHNKAVEDAVEEARRAADSVGITPTEKEKLVELCIISSSCRERGGLKK